MVTQDHIGDAIGQFIANQFQIANNDPLFTRDAHLYELGLVDSIGVVELIGFVESTFDIELQEEDLFSDQFTTIDGIAGIVYRRLSLCQSVNEVIANSYTGIS